MCIRTKKILAAAVGAAVILSSAGIVYAADSDKNNAAENTEPAAVETKNDSEDTPVKDETVYVFANADGSRNKIIVSDWLKNTLGENALSDYSELSGIENVKGNESFSGSGDLTWSANGGDIYYQGTIDKTLPVDMKVTYLLDGNEISPADLAGKSGKVTIRYEFTNNQYETRTIDGKEEKIYVPFAAITGMLLDNDVFTNVEAKNCRLINDGDRSAVVGIAFPGLTENLGLDSEKVEIPEYFEITADVKNFSLTNTFTVATNEVFNDIEVDGFEDIDKLTEAATKLTDAMDQLISGSGELADGLETLLSSSDELAQGVNSLAGGSEQLAAGAKTLYDGTGELTAGVGTLYDGLSQLDENSAALNAGAKQVFDTLLATANEQLKAAGLDVPTLTVDNYKTVLDGVLAGLSDEGLTEQAREKVSAAVNAQKDVITAKVTEAVRAQVQVKVLETLGMTSEQYEQGVAAGVVSAEQQTQIKAAIDAQMASDEVKALVEQNTSEQIDALIEQNMQSADVKNQLTQGKAAAKAGRESIKSLITQLDSYNEFYTGLAAYTQGVSSAKAGAEQLDAGAQTLGSGAKELSDGMTELNAGVQKLGENVPALIGGVTQLRDGAKELNAGIIKLNDEGISKLVNAIDGDIEGVLHRLDLTSEVSENYRTFSGVSDETSGQVKFVYRTEAIE